MTFQIIFLVSGLALALLIFTKMSAERRRRSPVLLRLISLGDERMRDLSHHTAHLYADQKDKADFFVKKQLPLHAKNFWNKSLALAKERIALLIGDIRGSRFLKQSDGLSEFFQSMSEKENGRIDDELVEDDSQKAEEEVK